MIFHRQTLDTLNRSVLIRMCNNSMLTRWLSLCRIPHLLPQMRIDVVLLTISLLTTHSSVNEGKFPCKLGAPGTCTIIHGAPRIRCSLYTVVHQMGHPGVWGNRHDPALPTLFHRIVIHWNDWGWSDHGCPVSYVVVKKQTNKQRNKKCCAQNPRFKHRVWHDITE